MKHRTLFYACCLVFLTNCILKEALSRPSEQERVKLWYEAGNTWPPTWQYESDKYKAAMDFREQEIMKITGADERWENFVQFTSARMVPSFTEYGFKVVKTPADLQAKMLSEVRKAVARWNELRYEHDVDAIYHPEGMAPKFVDLGYLAREV